MTTVADVKGSGFTGEDLVVWTVDALSWVGAVELASWELESGILGSTAELLFVFGWLSLCTTGLLSASIARFFGARSSLTTLLSRFSPRAERTSRAKVDLLGPSLETLGTDDIEPPKELDCGCLFSLYGVLVVD